MDSIKLDQEYSQIAYLIGEPTRARILWHLLNGRAMTATELCIAADLTMQNASNHLRKLVQADLLAVECQGRHRYYRFTRPEVAYVIEAIAGLKKDDHLQGNKNTPLQPVKFCRTCYDHLAGRVAVKIHDLLLQNSYIEPLEREYSITTNGKVFFQELGLNLPASSLKRIYARPCLDWSERKPHLAGAVGAALLQFLLSKNWIKRSSKSRVVTVTAAGFAAFESLNIRF